MIPNKKFLGEAGQKSVEKFTRLTEFVSSIEMLVKEESDRGAILIITAVLEELLGEIIKEGTASEAYGNELLKIGQPAGDFESRILIAQAFGLIHAEDTKKLKIVQRIRNKAAHFDRKGRGFNVLFDSSSTIDQVAELSLLAKYPLSSRLPLHVRLNFVIATRTLMLRLLQRWMHTYSNTSLLSEEEEIAELLKKYKATDIGDYLKEIKEKIGDEHLFHNVLLQFNAIFKVHIKKDLGVVKFLLSELSNTLFTIKNSEVGLADKDREDLSPESDR
ncbi:hypothetical protein [uncultured Hymenobacter sp.]|uniref:hypothetical protein n=1 Tax=uncultured Hymenobacter sp. TaxID=170016 RepID=UPI0035CB3008